MLGSLVKRVKNATEAFFDDDGPIIGWSPPDPLDEAPWAGDVSMDPHPVEQAYVDQFVTEGELEQLRRRSEQYFDVIGRIEKERNQWIVMWRDQSGEHLVAQGLLEKRLIETRQVAMRAISMLNVMRKDKDLDPIEVRGFDDLEPYDNEPVGTAERYAERLHELCDQLPTPIDGVAERSAIAGGDGPMDVAVRRTVEAARAQAQPEDQDAAPATP